ncbi:MAG: glycosyltransferase family 1 protein [Saprospiraceae bacterium]
MIIGVNARLLYSEKLEGISRYIYETTKEMAINHPEDLFILYHDRPITHPFNFPPNIIQKVVWLPTRHPILWWLWFEWLLPLRLKKDKVDVFYSGDGYLSLRSKLPTLMVTHDLAYLHYPKHLGWAIRTYYQYYIPKFHVRANTIIAVSKTTKEDIIQRFGLKEDKIVIAYNSVRELPSINPTQIRFNILEIVNQKTPYFLFVGALHPRKNIVKMCHAFTHFKQNQDLPCKLIIAGRHAWKSDSIQKAMDTDSDIIYLGSINEDEKQFLLKNASAMLYISLFEGFGIPILEAFNSKTPVITSNVSSMPEVAGNAGILVDPNDIEEISIALGEVLKQNLRKQLIEKGQQRLNLFSWKTSANKIYQSLLHIKNNP